jgi:hypothetical protein
LFTPRAIDVNFVQFSHRRAGRTSGASNDIEPTEDVMQNLATRLAITASIAALICATPVSLDLVRAGAAGPDGTARLALTLDSAQAHETHSAAHGDRGASSRGAAGRDHQASHQSGQRSAGGDRADGTDGKSIAGNGIKADNATANNVRTNDVKTNNVKANDIRANNVNANDVRVNNVKVNDVNATNVNATYIRSPYLARPAAVTATAVAVGTTVTVLPASCTIVVDDGVTYHHCGDTYYIASNGAYVVVNPPR